MNVMTNTITLEYISQDNEENFPGQVTTQVTYILTDLICKKSITIKPHSNLKKYNL